MTIATSEDAPRDNSPDTVQASTGPHAHLLHSASSQTDLLALKRQRVKSSQSLSNPEEPAPRHNDGAEEEASQPTTGQQDAAENGQRDRSGMKASHAADFLEAPSFAAPLLHAALGEPMSGFFQRLRAALDPCPGGVTTRVVSSMNADGVYMHKRPIRGPNGSSPLAVCGSVLHHVMVYLKQGTLLHSLDYGPANGADVTANILEEAPAKRVLATSAVPYMAAVTAAATYAAVGPESSTASASASVSVTSQAAAAAAASAGAAAPADAGAGASASGSLTGADAGARTVVAGAGGAAAAADEMPYLYLGPASRGLDDALVQKVIAFAESRPYHALRNNCIHFADTLVRALTGGVVRNAPLLYDLLCGAVPPVDNPMLLMMQLMLRMSWFMVVDGSPLAAAFLEYLRAASCSEAPPQTPSSSSPSPSPSPLLSSPQRQQQQQGGERRNLQEAAAASPEAAAAAAADQEERDNYAGSAAAATATTATNPGQQGLRVGGGAGIAPDDGVPTRTAMGGATEAGEVRQRGLKSAQKQGQNQKQQHEQQQDEERRQKLNNDHAVMEAALGEATACTATAAAEAAPGDVDMVDVAVRQ